MRRLPIALALAAVAAATLSACASTVSLEAAPDATAPQCASVIVALPEILAEGQVRITQSNGEKIVATAEDGFLSMENDELTIVAGNAALQS